MSSAARGYKWAEENLPPYTKPARQLFVMFRNCCAMLLAMHTIFSEISLVPNYRSAEFLEQYVPGLPQKIGNTAETVKNVSLHFYEKTLVFFKSQVLVFGLSDVQHLGGRIFRGVWLCSSSSPRVKSVPLGLVAPGAANTFQMLLHTNRLFKRFL
ncbi:hypothetical protein EVAR_67697_1 [Eumeta japonica]|uniref:Uncharacterized protein n=1 Tax=Eumeta variegata TaxID=151549 RepID=A0A4C1ZYQ8_EUMVA|nr:hypothetical protein EVAR_67697_1 [Eumeta japonica]